MLEIATPECAICGRTKGAEDGWFLMVESRWQDKVKILQWHHQLAGQAGIHRVCGPSHAQELVVHWMTTGSMNYPFARTRPDREPKSRRLTPKLPPDVDT